jgi:catechol 2,3-dioxygenase-like lactoylglutathione lyase family enzyme
VRGTSAARDFYSGVVHAAERLRNACRRHEDNMNRLCSVIVPALLMLTGPSSVWAQILNKDAPVVVGHYHLNVTSIEAHRKFWVDTLGGTALKLGSDGVEAIRFPDVLLILRVQPPTGPTRGTAFDHIGFAVPDVPALTTKVVANGYELTTGREPAPGQAAAAATGTAAPYGRFSYLVGPDGVKVELVTSAEPNAPPIKHHHVHFINKQYVEMQQWYMKALDATLRPGQTDFFIGADLPGVGYMLNFFRWEGDQSITHVGTQGRAVDHVGFEVKNLEEFCKGLGAKGITLTVPYRKLPGLNNIGSAFITDPWGTSIELTEGLRNVP